MLKAMQVVKTIELGADPTAVWNALTNPEQTKRYFFGCEAMSDWKVGSVLDYRCEVDGSKVTVVTGEIRAIDPERYLEHTCRAAQEDAPGEETVATYTLTAIDGGTQLSVTQGEFADEGNSDRHGASWDLVLKGLKTLVEG